MPRATVLVAGYYAQTARASFDGAAGRRGLVTVVRDAHGGDTATVYDVHELLPEAMTDPRGLTTRVSYDHRTLKPDLVTDPNGNRTAVGYSPLGLPTWNARLGKPGADEGDTVEQPGVRFDYDLTAWDDSPVGSRRPMGVSTTRRVEHRWTTVGRANAQRALAGQPPLTGAETAELFTSDEETAHPERFVRIDEFSDGFGRPLQIRTQGDELVIDDLGLGDDPATPTGAGPGAHRHG